MKAYASKCWHVLTNAGKNKTKTKTKTKIKTKTKKKTKTKQSTAKKIRELTPPDMD